MFSNKCFVKCVYYSSDLAGNAELWAMARVCFKNFPTDIQLKKDLKKTMSEAKIQFLGGSNILLVKVALVVNVLKNGASYFGKIWG